MLEGMVHAWYDAVRNALGNHLAQLLHLLLHGVASVPGCAPLEPNLTETFTSLTRPSEGRLSAGDASQPPLPCSTSSSPDEHPKKEENTVKSN